MWSRSSKRISSISNAAGSVSISTVARIVPCGMPMYSSLNVKTSSHSFASSDDSIFGR